MIALFSTYFLVFYILIPGILFRFATSLFVRLKLFQRTRTQEATFAVAVAILPFAIALLGVWYVPGLQQYPFPNANASLAERRQDYHRIASLLTSSDASKLLNSTTASAAASARDTNWAALNRVLRRQARFLTWYFALIVLEGFFFGRFARKYGDWQSHAENYRIRLWFIRTFVLPSISEWHMLLTDFNFPKRNDLFVSVDVLQGDGLLYKGRVVEYFIDSDGKLTGILLKDVVRFDRQSYHDAKSAAANPDDIFADDYWKNIPSQHFYIGHGSISNLNVRFAPRQDKTLLSLADEVLLEENFTQDYVVVESKDVPDPDLNHPDLYS